MMAANPLVPHVLLGSVYFEEATGDDTQPDIIQVSFKGGAAGTTLNRLTINGDKPATASPTATCSSTRRPAARRVSARRPVDRQPNGFSRAQRTVVDGGSQIVFTFSGFDAGEKLTLSIDADEAQFVEPGPLTPRQCRHQLAGRRWRVPAVDHDRPVFGDRITSISRSTAYSGTNSTAISRPPKRRLAKRSICRTINIPRSRLHRPHGRRHRVLRRRFHSPRFPVGSITTTATTACSTRPRKRASAA